MTTAPLAPAPHPTGSAVEAAMALLGSGVPLSLLLDLALGPNSEDLLSVERASVPPQRPSAA